MSIPPPEDSCQKGIFASPSTFLTKMHFPWPKHWVHVQSEGASTSPPASSSAGSLFASEGPDGQLVSATPGRVLARFSGTRFLQSGGFATAVSVQNQCWVLLALIWVKSFSCVGEKGLLRTERKQVNVYESERSEVDETWLGFCLGSLPPSFSVTEN